MPVLGNNCLVEGGGVVSVGAGGGGAGALQGKFSSG